MAYTDQRRNRTAAIGAVAIVHAAIGAALLSGLAVKFAPKPPTVIDGYFVPADPPPPPEPLPPEPKLERARPTTPPINAPIPSVRPPVVESVDVTTVSDPLEPAVLPPLPAGPPVAPAEPPVPPAVDLSRALRVRGDQGGWFPHDSYPAAARRAGAEGRVGVSVDVGVDGRVAACRVVSSSGNDELDAATCRLATRNGRFEPARDAAGNKVASSVTLRPVRWTLEQ